MMRSCDASIMNKFLTKNKNSSSGIHLKLGSHLCRIQGAIKTRRTARDGAGDPSRIAVSAVGLEASGKEIQM